jgi:hypothetical protein
VGDTLYEEEEGEGAVGTRRREAPGPEGRIGLQAFRLRVNADVMGPRRVYDAGPPWWQRDA